MISGYSAHGAGGRGINMFAEGHPMSYFNLIETDGLFRSAEEIANYKNKDGELIQPAAQVGDVRYKDWNGDGKINTDDQHDVGSPFPDFTFGIRLGGEWNNFDFNLFFDGMVGNKIYNYPRYRLETGNFNGNMPIHGDRTIRTLIFLVSLRLTVQTTNGHTPTDGWKTARTYV